MSLSITNLGEIIVSEIANRKRFEIIKAFKLDTLENPDFRPDTNHVKSIPIFAYSERRLTPYGNYIFDGKSRVDVALWIRPELAIGVEVKLGKTRLTRARFTGEFLADCRKSHEGTRIAGNMMAILDRRFEKLAREDGFDAEGDLRVELNGRPTPLKLSRNWVLVMQQRAIKNLGKNDQAHYLGGNVIVVSMNSLVEAIGGESEFNSLVKEIRDVNYFTEWLGG